MKNETRVSIAPKRLEDLNLNKDNFLFALKIFFNFQQQTSMHNSSSLQIYAWIILCQILSKKAKPFSSTLQKFIYLKKISTVTIFE